MEIEDLDLVPEISRKCVTDMNWNQCLYGGKKKKNLQKTKTFKNWKIVSNNVYMFFVVDVLKCE